MPIGPDTDRQGIARFRRDGRAATAGHAWGALMTGKPPPDDLGDLVDPQDDTYEEEGTHGLPLLAAAALPALGTMAAGAAGAAATSFGIKAGSNLADKVTDGGGGGGSTSY